MPDRDEPRCRSGVIRFRRLPDAPDDGGAAPRAKERFGPLINHGGRTIRDLTFQTVYLGSIWSVPSLADERQRVDAVLAAALNDPGLNGVFPQYFGDQAVSATALESAMLPIAWPEFIGRGDLRRLAGGLADAGRLPAGGWHDFVVLFVLPPGTILVHDGGSGDEAGNSMKGLGGFHGSFAIARPDGKARLRFGAVVWSDGENGAAVPGWHPWENACAGMYHELAEIRTNPDFDLGPAHWGWATEQGDEIADLPVDWARDQPQRVFRKVTMEGVKAPVQLLWCNQSGRPWNPKERGQPSPC
jgi:hypothetical protein